MHEPKECRACHRLAVFWNPYNQVVQCHACGKVPDGA
jgi:ribosomal protein S27E